MIAVGNVMTGHTVAMREKFAQLNLADELTRFVSNTLEHAARRKDVILSPSISTAASPCAGKTAVVVVRALATVNLQVLGPFIQEAEPVLVGWTAG